MRQWTIESTTYHFHTLTLQYLGPRGKETYKRTSVSNSKNDTDYYNDDGDDDKIRSVISWKFSESRYKDE